MLPSGRATDNGNGVLIITQVQTSDSGTYVCTATAGQYIVTDRAQLNVGGDSGGGGTYDTAPRLVISPQYKQAQVGDRVVFRCEAEGTPAPSISWRRSGGQTLGSGVASRGPVLEIRSVAKSHEGRYVCVGSNAAGTRETETVLYVSGNGGGDTDQGWGEMGVRVSPEDLVAKAGDSVTLSCSAQSSERLSIQWSKEDGRLSSSAFQDNGVLTIGSVVTGDSGIYVCRVSGQGGQEQETRARLTVQAYVGSAPAVSISPEWRSIGQGEDTRLVCEVTGDPAPVVQWSKVGGDLAGVKVEGNTVTVTSARVEDRGMYLCTAENTAGTARASTILEVEPREAPAIEIYPAASQTISTGGSVLYQCRANQGLPSPAISWSRRDGRPMSSNVEILSGGVIRMTRVNGEEEGEYVCSAENVVGRVEAVASLTIHEVPRVEITPRGSVTVQLGSPLLIRCSVSGDPTPVISWRKIGRSMKTVGTSSPVLQFNRVSKNDEGTYACVANNIAGETEERVQVIVTEDDYSGAENIPEDPRGGGGLVSRPETGNGVTYTVELGNNVRLTADIVGNMAANIRTNWTRGDGGVIDKRHYQYGNTLYINNATRQDAGTYICQGFDRAGAMIFDYKALLVIAASPRIRLSPDHQVVKPGDSPSVTCEVTQGDPPVSVTWSRPGHNSFPRSAAQYGRVLQFRGIAVSDAGRYVCSASNAAGQSEAVAEVMVINGPASAVQAKPDIQIVPSIAFPRTGDMLDVRCEVRGAGRAGNKVFWTKVGQTQLGDGVVTRGDLLR